jgi:prepilin-type N-terminal cleavage/methylation domain-containing protein
VVKRTHGFTLIELLIAMGVLAVVAVYLLETFTVNNRTYVAFDQTIEAQQNMRAIADLIERDVRHAGFMVPEGAAVCGIDSTNGPDTLYVSDHDAIDPGNDVVSYPGARITGGAAGNVGGGVVVALALDSVIIEPPSPTRPAYDTNSDGTNDSDFQQDAGAIVFDRNDPGRGVACGRVVAVAAGSNAIAVEVVSGTLGAVSGTPQLVVVPAVEYRVENGALLRNGLRLARGVEDLQIAYLFDINGTKESRGAGGGTPDYVARNQSVEDLLEVRISFVTRTRRGSAVQRGQLPGAGEPGSGERQRWLSAPGLQEHDHAPESREQDEHRMTRRETRTQGGSAMVIAMLMLMLMGLIGFAALATVTRDAQVSGAQVRKKTAFYAAEAAIAKALETMRTTGTPTVANTYLGDATVYPHGRPSFAVDSSTATPIESLGLGGFPGMNLQLGQDGSPMFQMEMFRVRVQGEAPGGSLSRIEIVSGVLTTH